MFKQHKPSDMLHSFQKEIIDMTVEIVDLMQEQFTAAFSFSNYLLSSFLSQRYANHACIECTAKCFEHVKRREYYVQNRKGII